MVALWSIVNKLLKLNYITLATQTTLTNVTSIESGDEAIDDFIVSDAEPASEIETFSAGVSQYICEQADNLI